jgi:hypothetical protein
MDFESVLAVLRTESEKRRRQTRIIQRCVAGLFVLQIVLSIVLAIRGKFEITDLATILMPLILIGGISAGFSPQAKNALIAALPESDPRLIGFLCEALASGDADLVALARERLETLFTLPNLESAVLTAHQQSALTASMVTATESFQLAALSGLARVGNKEAILTLEQYAAHKSPKVAAQAQKLVPDLRMRVAKGIIETELLRSRPIMASQPEAQPESISTKPD